MVDIPNKTDEEKQKYYNSFLKEELIQMLIESQRLIKHMIQQEAIERDEHSK